MCAPAAAKTSVTQPDPTGLANNQHSSRGNHTLIATLHTAQLDGTVATTRAHFNGEGALAKSEAYDGRPTHGPTSVHVPGSGAVLVRQRTRSHETPSRASGPHPTTRRTAGRH